MKRIFLTYLMLSLVAGFVTAATKQSGGASGGGGGGPDTTSIARDGTRVPTANQSWAGFDLSDLGNVTIEDGNELTFTTGLEGFSISNYPGFPEMVIQKTEAGNFYAHLVSPTNDGTEDIVISLWGRGFDTDDPEGSQWLFNPGQNRFEFVSGKYGAGVIRPLLIGLFDGDADYEETMTFFTDERIELSKIEEIHVVDTATGTPPSLTIRASHALEVDSVGGDLILSGGDAEATGVGDGGTLYLRGGASGAGTGGFGPVVFDEGNVAINTALTVTGITQMIGRFYTDQQSPTPDLTADDTLITVTRTFIGIDSDSAVATDRTFTLTNGLNGERLTLLFVGTATDTAELADTGNVCLSAAWLPTNGDTLSLMYSTTLSCWAELSRSTN